VSEWIATGGVTMTERRQLSLVPCQRPLDAFRGALALTVTA